ncbi:MAG: TatD family hydrolase [bacterium]|nr:TatD family hydrolase [bacterium]
MIDLHCHIDLYPDPQMVIRKCLSKSIFVLSVTTTPQAWPISSNIVSMHSKMPAALGLHPQLAGSRRSEVDLFDSLIGETSWLGEIGLDGAAEFSHTWQDQLFVFEHILKSASYDGGKIMSIHSRRAARDVLGVLRRFPDAGVPVLHWFSGTLAELQEAIDMGCWFSVGSPMMHSKSGRALIARIPKTRLLTESDGPFVQHSGGPAYPWQVIETSAELSRVWGVDPKVVSAQLEDNLACLLSSI